MKTFAKWFFADYFPKLQVTPTDQYTRLNGIINGLDTSGNARAIRNLIGKIILHQSRRVAGMAEKTKENLETIELSGNFFSGNSAPCVSYWDLHTLPPLPTFSLCLPSLYFPVPLSAPPLPPSASTTPLPPFPPSTTLYFPLTPLKFLQISTKTETQTKLRKNFSRSSTT
jgi:hypothetical protein